MLYALGQAQLGGLLLPLGDLTKAEVRAYAARRGLPVADRAESQDICFLRDNDYRRFLAEHAPEALRPGPSWTLAGGCWASTRVCRSIRWVSARGWAGRATPAVRQAARRGAQRTGGGLHEELGCAELLAGEMA